VNDEYSNELKSLIPTISDSGDTNHGKHGKHHGSKKVKKERKTAQLHHHHHCQHPVIEDVNPKDDNVDCEFFQQ